MLTLREKLTLELLTHLWYDETGFLICWHNNRILTALNILGVDQTKLFAKLKLKH